MSSFFINLKLIKKFFQKILKYPLPKKNIDGRMRQICKNVECKKSKRKDGKIMKKIISTMVIALVAIFMLGTVSMATTEKELENYMYSEHTIGGTTYKIQDKDKVKLQRFFKENDLTDAQATEIKNIIDNAINFMTADGANMPNKLSTQEKKKQLLSYAKQVATILGYTVSYDATETRLDIYKNGTQVDSLNWGYVVTKDGKKAATTEAKLAKTGSTNYIYAIGAGVVLIAGITFVIARKKANA